MKDLRNLQKAKRAAFWNEAMTFPGQCTVAPKYAAKGPKSFRPAQFGSKIIFERSVNALAAAF